MIRRLLLAFLLLLPFEADAVIYVQGVSASAIGTGAVTVTLPSNTTNDIILLLVQSSNEAITAPSGYTEIDDQNSMKTGTAGTAGAFRMAIFWKRAGASETNPTVATTTNHLIAYAVVIRGAITTGNPWDVETCGLQATTSTSVSWQSSGMAYGTNGSTLTTTVSGTLVLGFVGNAIDLTAAQLGTEVCGALNNVTEISDLQTTFGTGGGIGGMSGYKPGAGAVVDTGSNNMTATLVTTSPYAMFVIALKPASPSGPLYGGSGVIGGAGIAYTVPLPVGMVANDLILLVVTTANEAITAPAGYTEIDAQASMGNGTGAAVGSHRMGLFYKRHSGSESNPSIADTGNIQVAQAFCFKNVITSGNPYDVESVGIQATAATSADWTTLAYGSVGGTVTSTVNNVLVLTILSNATDTTNPQTTAMACGTLSGYVQIADGNIAVANGGGFGVAAGELATAGNIVNTSTHSFTATLATSSKYAMAVIALKPPVTGITTQQKAGFFMLMP